MRYSLRGILIYLALALAFGVGLAQDAPEEQDVVLARYTLALDNLRRSMTELPNDISQSLEHLERAAVPLGPLSQHTTSSALVSGMESTFDRARTAVRNQSGTDLMVQVSVLAGGFRRIVFESALTEATAGNMELARERLAYLARDMSLPEGAQEQLAVVDIDIEQLRAHFESGSVEAIQQRLDALVDLLDSELDVAVAYRLLAQAYGLFIPIQDSPRAPAEASATFLRAISALVPAEAEAEESEEAADAADEAEIAQDDTDEVDVAEAEADDPDLVAAEEADEVEAAEEVDPQVELREAVLALQEQMAGFQAATAQVLGVAAPSLDIVEPLLVEDAGAVEAEVVEEVGGVEEDAEVEELEEPEEAAAEVEPAEAVEAEAPDADVVAAEAEVDDAELAEAEAVEAAEVEALEEVAAQTEEQVQAEVADDEDEAAVTPAAQPGPPAPEAADVTQPTETEAPAPAAVEPSQIEQELRTFGLREDAVQRLLASYGEAGLESVEQAFDRIRAIGAEAIVMAGRGEERQAQIAIAGFRGAYSGLVEPLVASRDPALSADVTALSRTLEQAQGLRQQDVVTLVAMASSSADVLAGSRPPLLERSNVPLSQYWWGLPRMTVMIALAIFAFLPLILLNLAFGGGNRNWRWVGTSLLLLLLPVIFEGLGFLGSLLADVTAIGALNALAAYSIFHNPLTQVVWVVLTMFAILFASIGLYGICVQFGLLGSRNKRRGATATSTSTSSRQDSTVDWDEEF